MAFTKKSLQSSEAATCIPLSQPDPPVALDSVMQEIDPRINSPIVQCTGVVLAITVIMPLCHDVPNFSAIALAATFPKLNTWVPFACAALRVGAFALLGPLLDTRGRRPVVYCSLLAGGIAAAMTTLSPESLAGLVGALIFDAALSIVELGSLLHLVECSRFLGSIKCLSLGKLIGCLIALLLLAPEMVLGWWFAGDLKNSITWVHYCAAMGLALYGATRYRYVILYDSPTFLAYQEKHLMVWDSLKLLLSRDAICRITDNYRLMYSKILLPPNQPTLSSGYATPWMRFIEVGKIIWYGIIKRRTSRSLAFSLTALYLISYWMDVGIQFWIRRELFLAFGENIQPAALFFVEVLSLPAIFLAFRLRCQRRDFVSIALLSCVGVLFCLLMYQVGELPVGETAIASRRFPTPTIGLSAIVPEWTQGLAYNQHKTSGSNSSPLVGGVNLPLGGRLGVLTIGEQQVIAARAFHLVAVITLRILTAASSLSVLCCVLERITVGCRGTILGLLFCAGHATELFVGAGHQLITIQGYLPLCTTFACMALLAFTLESKVRMLGERRYEKRMALARYLAPGHQWSTNMATVSSRIITSLSRGEQRSQGQGSGASSRRHSQERSSKASNCEYFY